MLDLIISHPCNKYINPFINKEIINLIEEKNIKYRRNISVRDRIMSGAYLEYIEEISIEISDYYPIRPTAYIPLPETLPKCNNGIINIQNNDNWYFGWCVLEVLHLVKN